MCRFGLWRRQGTELPLEQIFEEFPRFGDRVGIAMMRSLELL